MLRATAGNLRKEHMTKSPKHHPKDLNNIPAFFSPMGFPGKLLCRIGLHDWGKPHGLDQFSSNVVDWKKKCRRCNAVRRWVEHKQEDYY